MTSVSVARIPPVRARLGTTALFFCQWVWDRQLGRRDSATQDDARIVGCASQSGAVGNGGRGHPVNAIRGAHCKPVWRNESRAALDIRLLRPCTLPAGTGWQPVDIDGYCAAARSVQRSHGRTDERACYGGRTRLGCRDHVIVSRGLELWRAGWCIGRRASDCRRHADALAVRSGGVWSFWRLSSLQARKLPWPMMRQRRGSTFAWPGASAYRPVFHRAAGDADGGRDDRLGCGLPDQRDHDFTGAGGGRLCRLCVRDAAWPAIR